VPARYASGSRIAIVGAGPAGAFAAEHLASAGFAITLFDPKGAWEKPCGGGVTSRALERYGFLLDNPAWPSREIERITLVGPSRARLDLVLDRPFRVYARERLNGLMLANARSAGAELVAEAVTKFERRDGGGWLLGTRSGEWHADLLVGADGAGSIVRRELAGRFRPQDVALTVGYNGPVSTADPDPGSVLIDFPADFSGYIWRFPRTDHINFGTFNRLNERPAAELKSRLHDVMADYYGGATPVADLSFFGAKVPMLTPEAWPELVTTGPDWALIGDAAGFVDPITGEGIYYAIRSGELFARTIAGGGDTAEYARAWRADFGEDLAAASRYYNRFYRGRFLGGTFVDRAIQFSRVHGGVRRVMRRALGGEQSYVTLKRDLVRSAAGLA